MGIDTRISNISGVKSKLNQILDLPIIHYQLKCKYQKEYIPSRQLSSPSFQSQCVIATSMPIHFLSQAISVPLSHNMLHTLRSEHLYFVQTKIMDNQHTGFDRVFNLYHC